jgi:DNA-binding MarR family transcriptional regulator
MESEGLIARRRNERNRLEVRVSITPQGRALQRRLAGAIERFDRKLLRSLSEADRLGLARVVARLEELSDAS